MTDRLTEEQMRVLAEHNGIAPGLQVIYVSPCRDHDNHAEARDHAKPLVVGQVYTIDPDERLEYNSDQRTLVARLREPEWWVDIRCLQSVVGKTNIKELTHEELVAKARRDRVIRTIGKISKEYAANIRHKNPKLAKVFEQDATAYTKPFLMVSESHGTTLNIGD